MQHPLRLALTFAALSFLLQAVLASISLKITTVIASTNSNLYTVALVTSILDLLGVSTVFALALSLLSFRRHRGLTVCYYFAVLPSFAGLGLTIYLLSRLCIERHELEAQDAFFREPLFSASFSVFSLSFLAHIIFYIILLRSYRTDNTSQYGETEKKSTRSTSSHSAKQASVRLNSLHNAPASPVSTTQMILPPTPTLHPDRTPSPKNTMSDSRTHLIKPESIVSRDDRSLHGSVRESDGFKEWDTSQIESASTPQLSKTRLEPIPGSRPVSPAKALNGPFDDPLPPPPSMSNFISHSEVSLPASVQRQASASSLRTGRSRADSYHTTRRPSTAQSNVHPLFRSESPHPPPIPSPNTIITASPYAGQIVSPDSALSGRRAASRPGSLHSSRVQSPAPSETHFPLPQG